LSSTRSRSINGSPKSSSSPTETQQERWPSARLLFVFLIPYSFTILIIHQVERALKLWKKGVNPAKTKPNFIRNPWGSVLEAHLEGVGKLFDRQWDEITALTQALIDKGGADESSSDESDREADADADNTIQVSDEDDYNG
jgi:hypothetical protein